MAKTAPDNYQAQSDMRTMIEANKIKADPKRMKACKDCAAKEMAAMKGMAEGAEGKPDAEGAKEDKAEVAAMRKGKK
jgi:hypothetical protein